jgi:hypothetical protein
VTGRLRVVPIVEGDGEVASIRILLGRIWRELLGGEYIDVLSPIRQPRDGLLKGDGVVLRHAVQLALGKLRNPPIPDDPSLILILLDSEGERPGCLAPGLLERASSVIPAHQEIACVLAHSMYETWFIAAADSLSKYLDLSSGKVPEAPEGKYGKSWIKERFKENYRETRHQPAMTQAMDLSACRYRSSSFDKLCRELELRLVPVGPVV